MNKNRSFIMRALSITPAMFCALAAVVWTSSFVWAADAGGNNAGVEGPTDQDAVPALPGPFVDDAEATVAPVDVDYVSSTAVGAGVAVGAVPVHSRGFHRGSAEHRDHGRGDQRRQDHRGQNGHHKWQGGHGGHGGSTGGHRHSHAGGGHRGRR